MSGCRIGPRFPHEGIPCPLVSVWVPCWLKSKYKRRPPDNVVPAGIEIGNSIAGSVKTDLRRSTSTQVVRGRIRQQVLALQNPLFKELHFADRSIVNRQLQRLPNWCIPKPPLSSGISQDHVNSRTALNARELLR